jgi:hypothetical protein
MEEEAKATQELSKFGTRALDTVDKLGNFLSKVFGTVPEDVVGLAGGDWLHHTRIRIEAKLAQRTEEILRERGRWEQTEPMSPSVALPLLEAARDETREELSEMWARMLANGMDKERRGSVRKSIIATVKEFDPLDAVILQKAFEMSAGAREVEVKNLTTVLGGTKADEFQLSLLNLIKLDCIINSGTMYTPASNIVVFHFAALGRQVIRACSLRP